MAGAATFTARMRAARPPRVRGRSRLSVAAFAVATALVLFALLGPFFAPHSPGAVVGVPFTPPSSDLPLGADALGRDAWSRLLSGGRSLIALAATATALAYLVGGLIGMLAAYSRSTADGVLMRLMDLMFAFPPLLLIILAITGFGSGWLVLVIIVAFLNVPFIARLVRASALEVALSGYVEAATARGDSTLRILVREILPNLRRPLAADVGLRLTGSILLIAVVNFLGLGAQPPEAQWALMISENRSGLDLNAWPIAAPVVLLALLTISINIVADSLAERRGSGALVEGGRGGPVT